MERELKITDAHSQNQPTQKLTVRLVGGSPWYGCIWINDEIFTIYVDGETGKITIKAG